MNLERIRKAIRLGLEPLAAREPLRLSEWAEANFYLSAESSYVRQRWESYPEQRAILDCMGSDDIEEVNVRKSARVGYTKMLLAAIGYFAEHKRRNQVVWQPTDEDSDEFVKTELEPMVRDVPCVAAAFPTYAQRHKDNTLRQKMFRGCTLHLRGGRAAKNYRRLTVSVAILDEVDAFEASVEREGPPAALARKRLQGATFPKFIAGGTPLFKEASQIESLEKDSAMRFRRVVPCPHCGALDELRFGKREDPSGLKWAGDDPDSVMHLCAHCGALFSQAEFLSVADRGRYVADNGTWIDDATGLFHDVDGKVVSPPRSVSFFIWTAYSRQVSWVAIVREFLAAVEKAKDGDVAPLQAFVNLTLGEPWKPQGPVSADELADDHDAHALREVPEKVLALTLGVDTQGDRLACQIVGWGRNLERWIIDYVELPGDPAEDATWERLTEYRRARFTHPLGGDLGVSITAIDSGGHHAQEVVAYARTFRNEGVIAIKGSSARLPTMLRTKPTKVDYKINGKTFRRGGDVWSVDTNIAKSNLMNQLRVESDRRKVHFPGGLPREYFRQLTSETYDKRLRRWVKPKKKTRNEALDTHVYAAAATMHPWLRLDVATESKWRALQAKVTIERPPAPDATPQESVKAGPDTPKPAAIAPKPRAFSPKGRGFATNW